MNIKLIVFLTVIFGGLLLFKQAYDYDFEKRSNLLEHVKIVKAAIDSERILSLKGDESDYLNPDYVRLKEQLVEMGEVIKDARYVYIMAKKDNNVVLLVDTQPKKFGNEGLAVPGEIYEGFDPNLEKLLKVKGDLTSGPDTDKWGTFISGLSSIVDKNNENTVIALVGIDVEVSSWYVGLFLKLLPWTLVIISLIFGEVIIYKNLSESLKDASRLAYLASVLEASGDAIYSVDVNERILSWNAGAEKLYGYTEEEALYKDANELIIPDDKKSEAKEDIEKVVSGKRMGYQERVRKNKKGETIILSLIMSPVYNQSNKVASVSIIARNISKQKKKDEELEKHNFELEKMNKLMLDRELAMMELKKKIKQYETK